MESCLQQVVAVQSIPPSISSIDTPGSKVLPSTQLREKGLTKAAQTVDKYLQRNKSGTLDHRRPNQYILGIERYVRP